MSKLTVTHRVVYVLSEPPEKVLYIGGVRDQVREIGFILFSLGRTTEYGH